jgi:DNA-directed RNA polymerase specialized sigma24 family protein
MWKRKRKEDELTEDSILSASSNEIDKLTLEQALKQLSQGQREVLTLGYFVGLSHREIEDLTGIPVGKISCKKRDGAT